MTTPKQKILIIDHQLENQRCFSQGLENYETIFVSKKEDALEILSSADPPDLIVLNTLSSVGIEELSKKEDKNRKNAIPIIVMVNDDEEGHKWIEAGAVDYIKPSFPAKTVSVKAETHLGIVRHGKNLENLDKERISALKDKVRNLKRAEDISQTLFRISNAVTMATDLNSLYKSIHQALNKVVDAANFFIAIYDKDRDSISFPYYEDEIDNDYQKLEHITKKSFPTAEVILKGKSMMFTGSETIEWCRMHNRTILGTPAEIWIGVPLKTGKEIIGAMAVQNYTDPEHFDSLDINLLHAVSGQIAAAIERKRSEEALRMTKFAVDSSAIGVFQVDAKGCFTYANETSCKMLGYSRMEFIGMNYIDIDKDNPMGSWQRLWDMIRQNRFLRFETGYITKSELTMPVEITIHYVNSDDHEFAFAFVSDISDRKDAEEGLSASEARFRCLVEDMHAIIFTTDKEGVMTYINPVVESYFGYTPVEVIGRNISEFIYEEDWELVSREFYRILTGSYRPTEYRVVSKSGGLVWVSSFSRVIKSMNEISGISGVMVDIDDRKKAEAKLRESEERYRTLSDVAVEGILFHDGGVAVDVNNTFAEMFGYQRTDIIGLNVIDSFVMPEDQTIAYKKAAMDFSEPYELRVRKKNGSTFPIEVIGKTAKYKGKVLRMVSITDLSDRKQTEEQFIQLQKMEAIGTLAGGVAHDFNNLLGGILGNIGLLKKKTRPDDPGLKRMETIEKIVERGADLSGQLLGYARGGKYNVQPIDLNDLVGGTINMFGRTQKQIQIHTKFQEGIWTVEGDKTQLEQVILNLFINSGHAMPEGGDLFIETKNIYISDIFAKRNMSSPGNYVVVSVKDTGHGMDMETRRKVFDPFFTTKETGKGTGLGLASAYGIIKNHKGNIEVYSEPGEGAVFRVLIPASDKELQDNKPRLQEELVKGSGTILLVDDEYEFRDIGEEMLREMGYEVFSADNGKTAVEIYRQNEDKIDLVVLDMIMPIMGGGETFKSIKKINPGARIFLSSGFSAGTEVEKLMARGALGFIQKPFHLIELSKEIGRILASGA